VCDVDPRERVGEVGDMGSEVVLDHCSHSLQVPINCEQGRVPNDAG
jgi:hypothetical protein